MPALGVALAVTNIDAVASVLSEAASASIGFATDKVTEIPQTLQEPVQESSATEYAGVSARTSNDSLPAQAGEGRPTKVLKVKLSDDGTASASDISSEATVIYVDGKSVSRQQLDALNPSQIKSMDVNKEGERTKIYVVSKSDDEKSADTSNPSSVKAKSLTIKKSDDGTTSTAKANWDATEVFIDGQSATREQLNALNPSQIKAMDVKKEEGVTKIYITLKSDSDK